METTKCYFEIEGLDFGFPDELDFGDLDLEDAGAEDICEDQQTEPAM